MVEVSNSLIIGDNVLATQLAGGTNAQFAASAGRAVPIADNVLATSTAAQTVEETIVDGAPAVVPARTERSNTQVNDQSSGGYETWWESFHILPRSFVFGNLLSAQTSDLEIYSAFRRSEEDWTSFTNNAGSGTTLSGTPSLPQTFPPQSDAGLDLTLEISTSGQGSVDTTLDFGFNTVPQTIYVPISLRRVVLFAIQPEMPFTERLQWLTEVMSHVDGTEQRLSLRKCPRQSFEWEFFLEDDGIERAFFHNVLFDWQARVFGLPVWDELTRLTSAVTAGDTTLTVQSTDYADYRVGGLILIFQNQTTYDVLDLDSVASSTSLEASSSAINSYPVGTFVMPLRVGTARATISSSRYISGDAKTKINFTVTDNDTDIDDLSAWSSYNGKLLIDTFNSVRNQMAEEFQRDIIELDPGPGLRDLSSPWANGKRVSQLALLTKTRQGLWELRQMLHALRGKQTSFYVPTFTRDLEIDADIVSGSLINVKNVGYTQFVQNRQPRNVIRIEFNNGDADEIREITSSSVVDSTREALTLDTAVSAHTASEVSRISFVEKVRWDSDSITIRHEVGERTKRITGPIRTVLE